MERDGSSLQKHVLFYVIVGAIEIDTAHANSISGRYLPSSTCIRRGLNLE
jgi:hypothetical protein